MAIFPTVSLKSKRFSRVMPNLALKRTRTGDPSLTEHLWARRLTLRCGPYKKS